MTESYQRRVFAVAADDVDLLTATLWAAGARGFELDDREPGATRLVAWFDAPAAIALGELAGRVREVARETVPERDWLAEYRAGARPIEAGGFVVDPRDPDDPAPRPAGADPRRFLRIPARRAFGTGSHETTRLVLELLAEVELEGRDVLDVGSGSGLLAFAALRLGARRAVGVDVDPVAALIAGANARLNGWGAGGFPGLLVAGSLACLAPSARFDLALVNVVPEEILEEVPAIVARLRPGGRLISSGNLAERRDALLARFAGFGLRPLAERVASEWIAFVLAREAT